MRLSGVAWDAGARQRRAPGVPKLARESNWRVVEVVVPGGVSRVHEARRVLASMLATLIGGSLCEAIKTAQQPLEQHLTFDEGQERSGSGRGRRGLGTGSSQDQGPRSRATAPPAADAPATPPTLALLRGASD
jgi:hypothetical protein